MPDGQSLHDARTEIRRLIDAFASGPEAVADLPATDLDLLIQLLRRVRLHARLAADLKNAGLFDRLPQVAKDQLDSALVTAEARRRVAAWELDRIAYAMRDTPDTPLICLKGCAYLLLGHANIEGRIFADVDLLVPEDCLDDVERLLNANGWITKALSPYDDNYYRRWTHELPPLVHRDRDVEIDIHHNIVPRTARLNPSPDLIIDAAVKIEGSAYNVPCSEDVVLHAMTHLMFDSDLADKLRDLVDIRDLLNAYARADGTFWSRLTERAEELNLERPAYYALRYTHRLLGLELPRSVRSRMDRCRPLWPIASIMDWLVPGALLPQHPFRPSRTVSFCRFLLYVRSHWIRMPPWLLAYHLSVKFYRTKLRRAAPS